MNVDIPAIRAYLARVPTWLAFIGFLMIGVMVVGCASQPAGIYKALGLKPIGDVGHTDQLLAQFSGRVLFNEAVQRMCLVYAAALATLIVFWLGVTWWVRRLQKEWAEYAVTQSFWIGLAIPVVNLFGWSVLQGRWDGTPGDLWLSLMQFWGGLSLLLALAWGAWLRQGTVHGSEEPTWFRLKTVILVVTWLGWLYWSLRWASASTSGATLVVPFLMLWLLWPTVYRIVGVALATVFSLYLLLLVSTLNDVLGAWLSVTVIVALLALLLVIACLLWSQAYRSLGFGLVAGVVMLFALLAGFGLTSNRIISRLWAMYSNHDPLGINFQHQQAWRAIDHSQWWQGVDASNWTYLPSAQDQYGFYLALFNQNGWPGSTGISGWIRPASWSLSMPPLPVRRPAPHRRNPCRWNESANGGVPRLFTSIWKTSAPFRPTGSGLALRHLLLIPFYCPAERGVMNLEELCNFLHRIVARQISLSHRLVVGINQTLVPVKRLGRRSPLSPGNLAQVIRLWQARFELGAWWAGSGWMASADSW